MAQDKISVILWDLCRPDTEKSLNELSIPPEDFPSILDTDGKEGSTCKWKGDKFIIVKSTDKGDEKNLYLLPLKEGASEFPTEKNKGIAMEFLKSITIPEMSPEVREALGLPEDVDSKVTPDFIKQRVFYKNIQTHIMEIGRHIMGISSSKKELDKFLEKYADYLPSSVRVALTNFKFSLKYGEGFEKLKIGEGDSGSNSLGSGKSTDELMRKIDKLEKEKAELLKVAKGQKDLIIKLTDKVAGSEGELEKLRKELEDSKIKFNEMKRHRKEMEIREKEFKDQISDLEKAKKEKEDELSKEIDHLKKSGEDFAKKINDLKKANEERIRKLIQEKERTITSLNSIITQKETSISELTKKTQEQENTFKQQNETYELLKSENESLNITTRKLMAEVEESKKRLEDQLIINKKIEESAGVEVQKYVEQANRLQERVNSLMENEGKVGPLTEQVRNMNERIAYLTDDNNRQKGVINSLLAIIDQYDNYSVYMANRNRN